MLTGKKFRLTAETFGIEDIRGVRYVASIPQDAVIRVISGPSANGGRVVNVEWLNRRFVVFADALHADGKEISDDAS